jgi:hypothetical protein
MLKAFFLCKLIVVKEKTMTTEDLQTFSLTD